MTSHKRTYTYVRTFEPLARLSEVCLVGAANVFVYVLLDQTNVLLDESATGGPRSVKSTVYERTGGLLEQANQRGVCFS